MSRLQSGHDAEVPRFGHTELPAAQDEALRRAIRLEWVSIAFLLTAVTAVYLVMGSSQAMKAAWAEDLLSFIPPFAFLAAVRISRRRPDHDHPYGYHRSVGVGHLVAATALVIMGAFMVWDSASGLVAGEHPPIGLMVVLGHEVWAGWLMITVMAYTAVPPVILGRKKMRLARELHDKVLYADADMNKADWMTAVGAIAGILGIGVGLWWADAAAALLISGSILSDGVRNTRGAVRGLMDARARTYDDAGPHPLVRELDEHLATLRWVKEVRSRVRDEGHVFHVESFAVPHGGKTPSLGELAEARRSVAELDWKLQDIVIVPVAELPAELDRDRPAD
ncbi:cation diffusion facilitator family transporter [Georgenia wangjunii]|uniref:cation diffusion facilitator family transporter n=1 Tax=Georgenia wangjunii TaxID=3117730 RepID=UPI002F25FB78